MKSTRDNGLTLPKRLSMFHASTVSVLVLFCLMIGLLLAADIWYVDATDFRDALANPEIRTALVLTLASSVVTTILAVLVAVPTAYVLSRRRFRGAILVDTLIDMCIVLPPLVIGVSLLVFFRKGTDLSETNLLLFSGLLESDWLLIRWLGVALKGFGAGLSGIGWAVSWLGKNVFVYHRLGIVLAQFLCAASYAVRVIKATFDEVDPRAEAVAYTLGCGQGRAFWMVTLPMIKPGIMAGAIMAWARAVGLFGPVQIIAGAVRGSNLLAPATPDRSMFERINEGSTEVLPTSINLEISIGQLEMALAVSLVMVAMAAVVLIAFRMFTRGTLFGTGASR